MVVNLALSNECISDINSDLLDKRLRLYVQPIFKNDIAALEIEELSKKMQGVRSFKTNPKTGSLLVVYDGSKTNETIIKRQIYRYITQKVFTNKVTDIEEIRSFSAYKSEFIKNINETNTLQPAESNRRYINQEQDNSQDSKKYHALEIDHVERSLQTDISSGLSKLQVEARVKELGLNVISEAKRKSILKRFLENLNEFSTKLLVGVGLLSTALGQIIDGIAILGIAAAETILSTLQQHKADQSLLSLKKMMVPSANVIRNGKQRIIDAKYLVPGDIIMVEAGERVPADARLIECNDLRISEAMLTGESAPVCKCLNVCNTKTELADRTNMIYMGTNILSGRGKAIVTATGPNTEIGKISHMLQNIKTECAPIQNKIKNFTTKITKVSLLACLGLSAVLLLRGASLVSVIILGISFSIGAIPESLPAVVTAAMALSVQKMAAKNVIVRKLPAVETLGSANVICCDKTGTLTMNEMTVKEIFIDNHAYEVTGSGYNPKGEIMLKSDEPFHTEALDKLLTAGILCNNSNLVNCQGKWTIHGDPTEGALLTAACKNYMEIESTLKKYRRLKEIPFDSSRRYMTVLVSDSKEKYAYCKGSLSKILEKCTSIYDNGNERLFTSTDKQNIYDIADEMGSRALRVLAFCYKRVSEQSNIESNFIFLGLVGMEDPPREEVKECIKKCHSAGIKVVMITGDNKNTAAAIGTEIGLLTDGCVLCGPELEEMTDDELSAMINNVQIFARTSPEQKYKIVKAFKKAGNVVAMTGDGVNDALAMKEADIGIAMGAGGSDVAKDTADIILTDDNFCSIVAAIEEGRAVNRNIKNSMKYLLSGCLGEMIALGIATVFTGISPLISMQILWLNVIAETVLGSSLTLETPSEDIMTSPPISKYDEIIDSSLLRQVIRKGIITGLTTYGIFRFSMLLGSSVTKARTLAFTNLIISQIINLYCCKTNKRKTNKYMNFATIACLLTLGGIIYIPMLRPYFSTTPLLMNDYLLLGGTSAMNMI